MAIWLFRAGKSGEYENKFLNEGRIYLTWGLLDIDLSNYPDKEELFKQLFELFSYKTRNTIRNWLEQIYPIAHVVEKGDWVILPSKVKPVIHIGEITGDYVFHPIFDFPFDHSRAVDWFATNIPRSKFDQDLLYSFGAFSNVYQINRYNAEERIRAIVKNSWNVTYSDLMSAHTDAVDSVGTTLENSPVDLEEFTNDQIGNLLIHKFKGPRIKYLIKAILQAKGYDNISCSLELAARGADILAISDSLRFENPRLCVQVKMNDELINSSVLDQLLDAMQYADADQGILVSWSGFKNTVQKKTAARFFKISFWSQEDIVEEFLKIYDKLDLDIKREIPLKRIWALSMPDEE